VGLKAFGTLKADNNVNEVKTKWEERSFLLFSPLKDFSLKSLSLTAMIPSDVCLLTMVHLQYS